MLVCVRWYAAYPLSLRNLEEMMAERGVLVDHATVHRWALKMLPVLAAVFRQRKLPVGKSWRVDETYVLVGGQWKYLLSVSLHAVTFELSFGTNGPFIVSLCFVARGVTRFCHPVSQAHVVTQ